MNGNGKIDYTEWLAATLDYPKILKDQKLQTAFEFFDKSSRGRIGVEDLKLIVGSKRKQVNESVYLSIINEVDADNDGEINFPEFKRMILELLKDEQA